MRAFRFSKRFLPVILMVSGGALQSAQAQSFDCGKVQSDLESAICSTPELARMDTEVAILYRTLATAAETAPDFKKELQEEQRVWLHSRREDCGGDVDCLEKLYKARVKDLRELAKKKLSVQQ